MARPRINEIFRVPRVAPLLTGELANERSVERVVSFRRDEDPHPSHILATQSIQAGRFLRLGELYDHMLDRDSDLEGLVDKRFKAVLGLPRRIIPSDASPEALETAEFCRQALSFVPNLHVNLGHQLQGVTHGLSIDELVWERIQRGPLRGAVLPVDIIDRPMWRFCFIGGRLHVLRSSRDPLLAPAGKFLCYRRGTKDSPWGKPLLDRVFWPWLVKKHAVKYWAIFVEKWAQPAAGAKFDPAKQPRIPEGDKKAPKSLYELALEAASAIQTDFAVAWPEGITLELIEAKRSGSASYESFVESMTRAQARVIHGEVDTSGLGKGPGSFAKAEVSAERGIVPTIRIDAHELSTHLTDNLLRPLVQLNFPPEAPVPRWWIDVDEAEDRVERRAGVEFVRGQGLAVPEDHVYRVGMVPRPREGEPVVGARLEDVELERAAA